MGHRIYRCPVKRARLAEEKEKEEMKKKEETKILINSGQFVATAQQVLFDFLTGFISCRSNNWRILFRALAIWCLLSSRSRRPISLMSSFSSTWWKHRRRLRTSDDCLLIDFSVEYFFLNAHAHAQNSHFIKQVTLSTRFILGFWFSNVLVFSILSLYFLSIRFIVFDIDFYMLLILYSFLYSPSSLYSLCSIILSIRLLFMPALSILTSRSNIRTFNIKFFSWINKLFRIFV